MPNTTGPTVVTDANLTAPASPVLAFTPATTAAPKPAVFNYSQVREYQGIVFDKWPFRLDICVEYQDWILVGVSMFLLTMWCLPCICGHFRNGCSKGFTKYIYTRLNVFFWTITYVNLAILMFTIGILPDWTVNEYGKYLTLFISWILIHLKKMITSAFIIVGFIVVWKFQEKIRRAAGLEHITMIHFSLSDFLGLGAKKRPVELFVWKVEDLQARHGKIYKPNDIFIECHMGDNEPMRTRVHNNAGTFAEIKESFQMNINEKASSSLMTLLVKDQALMTSTELARLMLSTREVCGIEDQTGKRKVDFTYSPESFVCLNMIPNGKIWVAIAPVEDIDEESRPLMRDDDLVQC